MPQKDQSSRLGSSPSPIANRIIKNSENGQKTLPPNGTAVKQAYNKKTVKV